MCRTRPNFPADLPARVSWTRREHRGFVFFEYDGGSWLIHTGIETGAELENEMLAEAFGGDVPSGACIVGLTLEPVTRNTEAIALLEEVIAALENKCGGIVLPV